MEHLKNIVNYFKGKGETVPRATDELFQHIEEVFLPHLLRVIQKDNTLLAEVELFPGLHPTWTGSDEEWKLLHMALLYSVLHGDPKEKFGKIFETIKGMVPGGSAQTDEIMKILEDDTMQDSLKDILDIVMNTRLASLVGEIVQSIQFADLGINLEDPEQLLDLLRNPQENVILKELMERAQSILEDKVKTGKINQQELAREVETIRAKLQSAFGKYLNEAVVGAPGNTTGNTAQQILSNSPDARRARMLARLQKKQREKLRK
jgi:hypothetical protein